MEKGLFGSYYVTPTATAVRRAWGLCRGSMSDYQRIRRHGLKLAHWPSGAEDPAAHMDLDWDWVRTLEDIRVGELRIDEEIAGHRNLRIIFFKANVVLPSDPMPRIWPLTVFPKKRQDFSQGQIRAWKGRRNLVVVRTYGGNPLA